METLSPVVERRSRRIGPVDHTAEEVPPEELNDDEEERSRYRKQLENDARNHSANEKRLSASEKSLSEHFQSCIQLAAENKINAKNAFNFKLIDLLHVMLSKKKQIHDFTEVTCSLDAGVKIYSYRVDNVHSDTMKMATTICSASNKAKKDEENETEEASSIDEVKKKKHSKKTKKNTLATNIDHINRNKTDEQFGIPRSFLSTDNFIISSAIYDNSRMCLHLDITSNYWKNDSEAIVPKSSSEVPIELPAIQDDFICPTFKDFSFKGETDYHNITLKEKITHEFNFEPPVNDHGDDNFFDNDTMAPEPNDVEPNEQNKPIDIEDITSQTVCLSKVMSSSHFASDISRLIASETSEYCYFNTQLLKNKWSLRSMGHWNPFMKKKEIVTTRARSQKRDLIDVDQHDDYSAFEDDAKLCLTITTTTNRDKFIITPITHFNFREFFRLKTCREMYVVSTSSNEDQPSDLEETINDYNYDNPNDSQNCNPERYDDDYADTINDGVAIDVHDAIDKSILQGDNLIEIPNKVAKIQLPYMVKDKSVDMKKLKSKIWQKIETSEKKAKEDPQDKLLFTEICHDLNVDSKSELSVPILFNAILQLANDKNLHFEDSQCNLTNFSIRVAGNIESN